MNIPKEERNVSGPTTRMPLTALVKLLRLKMASLQSHRTQCCCCAVGVFAAMFGIFMLSAGICIVLNVTFMEVDTSGLPPDLHNDNGKKIVGIILICVAITFLGLSATVSILYFTLCNRKAPVSTVATSNGYPKRQNGTTGATAGTDRPRSREGASNGQPRPAPLYMDGAQSSRSAGHVRSEYSKHKNYRGRKNALSRSMLPPHEEEDPEATKSAMELDNEQHFTRRYSQGKTLGQINRETNSASTSIQPLPKTITPVIVVQVDESNDFMETQLNETVSIYDEDDISNSCSDVYETPATAGQLHSDNIPISGLMSKSYLSTHNSDIFKQNHLEDSDLQPLPHLPINTNIPTDQSSSSSSSDFSSLTSKSILGHNLLVVRPALETDQESPPSPDPVTDIEEITDHLRDLPLNFNYQTSHADTHNDHELNSRTQSISSFNSAFSFDGDDPNQGEMKTFQKKLDQLLESDNP